MEEKVYCYICAEETEDFMLCDICENHYCGDCSYIFSLHYQFEGSRCYDCANQRRRKPLDKQKIRENKLKIILENK